MKGKCHYRGQIQRYESNYTKIFDKYTFLTYFTHIRYVKGSSLLSEIDLREIVFTEVIAMSLIPVKSNHANSRQEETNTQMAQERSKKKKNLKRYNLVIPDELFNEVQELADEKHTTVVELFRRFIKLGLLAAQIENSPEVSLLIREGDTEREIIML